MFTGIVAGTGEISKIDRDTAGAVLWIRSPLLEDAMTGASVAVDGVCLTVTAREADAARFDVSAETLARTTLGAKSPEDAVNLERPLRAGSEMGGHIVQGHVDAVGRVEQIVPEGGGARMRVSLPPELERYVVEKGSVTVDGVSLTVAGSGPGAFEVALVPHTLEATTFAGFAPGRVVNLEVDVIAKYVERMLEPWVRTGETGPDHGYL